MINDEKIIPERDRFIYEVVTDNYKFEWDRYTEIEKKAATTLGFIGVTFSLETTAGLYILRNIQDGYNFNFISMLFFSLSLIFLLISIVFCLNSLWLKKWLSVPNIKYFMREYVNADKNSIEIIRNLYKIYEVAIDHNHDNNEEKVKILGYSIIYFAIGILFLFLWMSVLFIVTLL